MGKLGKEKGPLHMKGDSKEVIRPRTPQLIWNVLGAILIEGGIHREYFASSSLDEWLSGLRLST